jgi:hypothetical protein
MERKKATLKRTNAILASALALVLVLGVLAVVAPAVKAAGPCKELAYADGQEFCIFIAQIVTNPSPALLASAEPIYIAAYLPLPAGCNVADQSTCHPETLPSGYVPQCNPCFHGGALNNFPYHDHVMAGAPGLGNMTGPWLLYVVAYDPVYSNQPSFTPFESTSGIATGESNGDFLQLNPSAPNPYEINTGVVLIFGVQPLGS